MQTNLSERECACRSLQNRACDLEVTENRAKFALKSILEPLGRPGAIRGGPGTRAGRPRSGPRRARDGPRPLLARPGALQERPGTLQDRPGTLQERPRGGPGTSQSARGARSCRRTPSGASADRFWTFSACRAEAPKCVLHHSCQCFVDVGRFSCERPVATKNLEKGYKNRGKSMPGAPRGQSGRSKIEPERVCSSRKRSMSARSISIFF